MARYKRRPLHIALVTTCALLLLLTVGCAGPRGVDAAPAATEAAAGTGEFSIPAPSQLRNTAYRETDLVRDGSAFVDAWPHRHVEATGPSLVFSPGWQPEADPPTAEPAFAIYGFNLDAYDRDATVRLAWATPRPDSDRVWIGLGNTIRDVWEWHRSPSNGVVPFDRDVHFDKNWRLAAAIVVTGDQPCELASLRLGDPEPWWFTTWGGSEYDSARCIALGPEDAVYVGGITKSYDPDESYDAFAARFDKHGYPLWQRSWGLPGRLDEVADLAVSPEGDVLLTGRVCLGAEGPTAIMVMKLSCEGEVHWQQAWTTAGSNWGRGIGLDSQGAVYITGEADFREAGLRRVIPLLKYDSDGELLWQVAWDNDATDIVYGFDLAVDTRFSQPFIYVAGASRYFEETWYDVVLLKFADDGTLVWQRTWGDAEDATQSLEYPSSLSLDGDGNVFVHGDSEECWSDPRVKDVFTLKFSSEGDLLWSRKWGTPSLDWGQASCVDSTGNLYCTACTYGVSGRVAETLVLLKCDPLGNVLFQRLWAPNLNNYPTVGSSLAINESGTLFLAGQACKADGCWYALEGASSTSPDDWIRPSDGYVFEIAGTVTELDFELNEPMGTVDNGGGDFDVLVMKYTP